MQTAHLTGHIRRRTHPVSDVEETLLVCEIKQEKETHCISKKSRCQTPKPENDLWGGGRRLYK